MLKDPPKPKYELLTEIEFNNPGNGGREKGRIVGLYIGDRVPTYFVALRADSPFREMTYKRLRDNFLKKKGYKFPDEGSIADDTPIWSLWESELK